MMMKSGGDQSRGHDEEAKLYRGVRKRKWGKWVSEIRLPNSRERIWLGSYDSPEKAARAFDAALFCLRGNTANFNFPDQPPDIPGGTDLHPSQIQAVAADFANSYHHHHHHHESSTSPHDHQRSNACSTPPMPMPMPMDAAPAAFIVMDQQEHHNNNNNSISINYNIPEDYGIFPGFDDYFMPMQPPLAIHDYGSELDQAVVYDGVYSHDPSFLWNF